MAPAGHDPDDWFDEPGVPDAWTSRVDRLARARQAQPAPNAEADDWISATAPRAPRVRRRVRAPAVLLAALVLALLFGVLVAAGVFSTGSGKPGAVVTAHTPTTARTPTAPATTTPAKPAVVVPSSTLKPGDSGTQVKLLQRALADAGYSPGAIDGSYGPGTEDAVRRFQEAHGLAADGVAGPQTRAALVSAVRPG